MGSRIWPSSSNTRWPPAQSTSASSCQASVWIFPVGMVTWVNSSGIPHDVDFGTPSMRIPVFDSGQRSLTFPAAGSFAYHCNLHAGMEARIVVR